jgi:hypothetical protein
LLFRGRSPFLKLVPQAKASKTTTSLYHPGSIPTDLRLLITTYVSLSFPFYSCFIVLTNWVCRTMCLMNTIDFWSRCYMILMLLTIPVNHIEITALTCSPYIHVHVSACEIWRNPSTAHTGIIICYCSIEMAIRRQWNR